jgi:23S rRNA G2069 N7-methylase RlmK/C1962 C5-methylase RlmI
MKSFEKLLKARHTKLRRLFTDEGSDCFRIYDRDLQGYPFTIDIYNRHLLLVEYEPGEREAAPVITREAAVEIASSMLYIDPDWVIYKYRPKRRGLEQHEKLRSRGERIRVREKGLTFLVNLTDYIDTGLFMNHRLTRFMVMQESLGQRVLNLFAYTGSFTVAAAGGGALETVSVDLSNTYLQWARENMETNGFIGGQHRFVRSDARTFLMDQAEEAKGGQGRYDLIILDPPLFSNSHKTSGTFDLQRDYVWFIASAVKLLSDGGRLLFSVPKKEFHFDPGRILGCESREITRETIPPDFTGRKPHRSWVVSRKRVKIARKSS